MPTRRIPKNYRNVTGISPHRKAQGEAGFESTLERDFLTLLEFDVQVKNFEVQPVTIEWTGADEKLHHYTPDALVYYQDNLVRPPSLFEVKYRSELREKWPTLRHKFKAAIRYCRINGWRFKIVTEAEIRTPLLINARFLLSFVRQEQACKEAQRRLADSLTALKITTPSMLLYSITHDEWEQASLIPTLWHMIATGQIGCGLHEKLTMESRLWLVPG